MRIILKEISFMQGLDMMLIEMLSLLILLITQRLFYYQSYQQLINVFQLKAQVNL